MEKEAMLGYIIQVLKNKHLTKEEILKTINEIQELEENLSENEARAIFYEFPEDIA